MDLAIIESMNKGSTNTSLSASQTRRFELLDRVAYRLAETDEDKDAIYRLRYRAYLKEGAIESNADRIVTDRFDDMSNSWTFGVYLEGELVSSVRVSVSSLDHPVIPSCDVFPDVIEPLLAAGQVIVDPTRFVADPDRGHRFPDLPYITLRLTCIACAYFNADTGLASVRPEHQTFYRRVFQHRLLSEARAYPGLIKPICLMAVKYPEAHAAVYERHPYFQASDFEQRKLYERRVDSQLARAQLERKQRIEDTQSSLQSSNDALVC
jgi:hypothetical protein